METIKEILDERGSRYGDFKDQAQLSDKLRDAFFDHYGKHNSKPIEPYMMEALILIFHKLARIANGDPYYDDSWRDICGYAQLVVEELNKDKE